MGRSKVYIYVERNIHRERREREKRGVCVEKGQRGKEFINRLSIKVWTYVI